MPAGSEWWRRRALPKPTSAYPWRAVPLVELSARAAAALIAADTGLLAWGTPVRAGPDGTAWAVVLLPDGDAGEPVFLRTLGECAPWFRGVRVGSPIRTAPAPDAVLLIEAQLRAVLDAAVPPSPTTETEADAPIAAGKEPRR